MGVYRCSTPGIQNFGFRGMLVIYEQVLPGSAYGKTQKGRLVNFSRSESQFRQVSEWCSSLVNNITWVHPFQTGHESLTSQRILWDCQSAVDSDQLVWSQKMFRTWVGSLDSPLIKNQQRRHCDLYCQLVVKM